MPPGLSAVAVVFAPFRRIDGDLTSWDALCGPLSA